MNETSRHLILYDGVCGFCNRLNQFVLTRDGSGRFLFASLQSPMSSEVLKKYRKSPEDLDTLYVLVDYGQESERLLSKARAALFILVEIGGTWRLASLLNLLPTLVLDAGYDLLARVRYRLFGKYATCLMPRPEYRERFLDI
ncbi:MAG: thiol-disulfide oxidoreductase DCC family protein [Chloroflexia bacterium]